MYELPKRTLRDLGLLLVVAFDAARLGVRATVTCLRPWLEPPKDLRVHSSQGYAYSGVLVIDDNEVLAGVVVKTGNQSSHEASATRVGDWMLGSSEEPVDKHMPGWADDGREGHPW